MKHIIPALITPYDTEGNISKSVLRALIRWHLQEGATGFYVCGSSAEFPFLSLDERKRVIEIVRNEVNKEFIVICQVGALRTTDTILLAKHAEAVGADMISSVPPIYYQYSSEETESYFYEVAQSTKLPFLIYHVPSFSSMNLNVDQINHLLANDHISGVKYTSYDLFAMECIRSANPGKTILIGHDELFLPALILKADGGIGSIYNLLASKFVRIVKCYEASELDMAYQLQSQINKIVNVMAECGIFPSIKYVLGEMGFDCGHCRRPIMELSNDAKNRLKKQVLNVL